MPAQILRAEQLLAQLDHVAARDTVAHRQRRDRRLQARPERAAGDLGRQLARALDAAAGAAHALAAMLGHPDRDLRQLLDLMARRLADRDPLALGEHVAAAAALGPMLDDLVDRPRRQQLTTVPLMPRLAALRRPERSLPAPRGGAPGGS